MQSTDSAIKIPLDVAPLYKKTYEANIRLVTQDSGRLMLFAGDQKVEHLHDDFYGEGISLEDSNPEHMFRIASQARIGAFATQFGLITKYGMDYPTIPYIVKLNSKTNLVPVSQAEPVSRDFVDIDDVLLLRKQSKLPIVGIGYTVYIGSEWEHEMLRGAAKAIVMARNFGLMSIVWMYPRGKAVVDEKNPHLIAGAAGVGATLGADFVKVNAPKVKDGSSAQALTEAVAAAGRTKVICAGGSSLEAEKFLSTLYDQIHIGGTSGNATGRNIHQRPLSEAVRFANAIACVTFDNKSVSDSLKIYNGS